MEDGNAEVPDERSFTRSEATTPPTYNTESYTLFPFVSLATQMSTAVFSEAH